MPEEKKYKIELELTKVDIEDILHDLNYVIDDAWWAEYDWDKLKEILEQIKI